MPAARQAFVVLQWTASTQENSSWLDRWRQRVASISLWRILQTLGQCIWWVRESPDFICGIVASRCSMDFGTFPVKLIKCSCRAVSYLQHTSSSVESVLQRRVVYQIFPSSISQIRVAYVTFPPLAVFLCTITSAVSYFHIFVLSTSS